MSAANEVPPEMAVAWAIARGVVAGDLLDRRTTSLDRILALCERWNVPSDSIGYPVVGFARRLTGNAPNAGETRTQQIARLMRSGTSYADAKRHTQETLR